MSNLSTKRICLFAILLLQIVASLVFVIAMATSHLFPVKYIILISVAMLACAAILVVPAIKITKSWHFAILITISVLLSVLFVVGTFLVNKTDSVIKDIAAPKEYHDQIVVVVPKDSTINSAKDLNNKVIGMQYSVQPDLMLAAEGELVTNQQLSVRFQRYQYLIDQVNAMFGGRVDAIVYNETYTDLIDELIEDYDEKIKVIYTCGFTEEEIVHYKMLSPNYNPNELIGPTEPSEDQTGPSTEEIEPPIEPSVPDEPTTSPTEPPNTQTTKPEKPNPPKPSYPELPTDKIEKPEGSGVFAVYLSGIDVYGSITRKSRSDVNIIAIVNPDTNKILLINTPRDYFVEIPGVTNGEKDKLTHAGIYGVNTSMSTLEQLYGVELDYYLRVNFTSFEKIVDELGGITVSSKYAFSSRGYTFQKGDNYLNGKAALVFCRERYSFAAGDNQRGKNQQEVIKAIIKKACSPAILPAANDILDSVRSNIDTNMPEELIQSLIRKQLEDGKEWDIETLAATGSGDSRVTYSMPGMKVYVMLPNANSIKSIKEAIKLVYAF